MKTRMRAVGEIAKAHGARVLVDEVYLEAFYGKRPRPAFHFGDHFLVTSSLTKAFGLSGLRCGWVLANQELVQPDVAHQRSVRCNAGASRGVAERDCVRPSGQDRGAREIAAGGKSQIIERLSGFEK